MATAACDEALPSKLLYFIIIADRYKNPEQNLSRYSSGIQIHHCPDTNEELFWYITIGHIVHGCGTWLILTGPSSSRIVCTVLGIEAHYYQSPEVAAQEVVTLNEFKAISVKAHQPPPPSSSWDSSGTKMDRTCEFFPGRDPVLPQHITLNVMAHILHLVPIQVVLMI